MPAGFEALAVAVFFLAPGLLYELGIERQVGYWRTGLGERTLRFFTLSILYQVAAAPLWWVAQRHLAHGLTLRTIPAPLWIAGIAYLAMPLAVGLVVGRGLRRRRSWTKWFVGRDAAPKAWDHLFSTADLEGYVRVLTADGTWVAGLYAGSDQHPQLCGRASSYPEAPDLYLSKQIAVDAETGELLLDAQGQPLLRPWGLWLNGGEIRRLEFLMTNVSEEAR